MMWGGHEGREGTSKEFNLQAAAGKRYRNLRVIIAMAGCFYWVMTHESPVRDPVSILQFIDVLAAGQLPVVSQADGS